MESDQSVLPSIELDQIIRRADDNFRNFGHEEPDLVQNSSYLTTGFVAGTQLTDPNNLPVRVSYFNFSAFAANTHMPQSMFYLPVCEISLDDIAQIGYDKTGEQPAGNQLGRSWKGARVPCSCGELPVPGRY